MNITPKTLPSAAPAIRLETLHAKFVAVQFSNNHIATFSCSSGDVMFDFHTDRPFSVFTSAMVQCGSEELLLLYIGYEDGTCEVVKAPIPDSAGDRNSFFDLYPVATMSSRDIIHTFDSGVSAMSSSLTAKLVLVMDRDGSCVCSRLDADCYFQAVSLLPKSSLQTAPNATHLFSLQIGVPWPAWTTFIESPPSVDLHLVAISGSSDGSVETFAIGCSDEMIQASRVSCIKRFDSAIAAAFVVGSEHDNCKFVVVQEVGLLSVLSPTGLLLYVGHCSNFEKFEYFDRNPIQYVELWRHRFLVVLCGQSIYFADFKRICEPNLGGSAPKFVLISDEVDISSVHLTEDMIALSISNGALLHSVLPMGVDGDAEDEEYFDKDVIQCVTRWFSNSTMEGKSASDAVHLLEIEKQRLDDEIKKEETLARSMEIIDDEIRKFVALNRIIQHEMDISDPYNLLMSGISVSVKLEPARVSESVNANIIIALSSTSVDHVEAVHGRQCSFSITLPDLAASTSPVQSLSCPLIFMSSAEGRSYTAEVVFPAFFDFATRHILSVEVEISMLLPNQFINTELLALTQHEDSSECRSQSKYAGLVLPLASLEINASDILSVVKTAESLLSEDRRQSLMDYIISAGVPCKLPVRVPILSGEMFSTGSFRNVDAVVNKLKNNSVGVPQPIPFKRPSSQRGRNDMASQAGTSKHRMTPSVEITELPSLNPASEDNRKSRLQCVTFSDCKAIDVLVAHSHELLQGIKKDLVALCQSDERYPPLNAATKASIPLISLPTELLQVCTFHPLLLFSYFIFIAIKAYSELSYLMCEIRSSIGEEGEHEDMDNRSKTEARENKTHKLLDSAYKVCALYFKIRNAAAAVI